MLYPIVALLVGLVILVLGADRFVGGAAAVARHFGLPPLLIGIVVIGFGTSMPEMLVSATAAFRGTSGIALGNAYGSNITNILLILGLCSIISPIKVTAGSIHREIPLLLAATALCIALLWDGVVSRVDAIVMLAAFAACLGFSIYKSMRPATSGETTEEKAALPADAADEPPSKPAPIRRSVLWVLVGLGMMMASSEMLVWGAVSIATHFGVSDLVIGLTIVAVGTSLPELASSVMAARKGEDEMALGNIIGSNTFNALMVVGVAALIHPLTADADLLRRDLPVMAATTVLLYAFCWGAGGKGVINRIEGAVLLSGYAAYTVYLLATSGSAA